MRPNIWASQPLRPGRTSPRGLRSSPRGQPLLVPLRDAKGESVHASVTRITTGSQKGAMRISEWGALPERRRVECRPPAGSALLVPKRGKYPCPKDCLTRCWELLCSACKSNSLGWETCSRRSSVRCSRSSEGQIGETLKPKKGKLDAWQPSTKTTAACHSCCTLKALPAREVLRIALAVNSPGGVFVARNASLS